MNVVESNIEKLIALCEKHKVKELYLFGSILTDRFNDKSDIDMLVKFHQVELFDYFNNYMDFKEKLELLFNRPIDLVEIQAIRNPIFKQIIDRNKQFVYERKSA